MRLRMKAVVAGLAAASLFAGFMGAAFAAAPPPWETPPDAQVRGNLVFYDAAGNIISGGPISASPFAAYVRTTTVPPAQFDSATLYGARAVNGTPPSGWTSAQMNSGNTYPVAGAPGGLATSPDAVSVGSTGDLTLQTLQTNQPHPPSDTGTAYEGMYQIRLKLSSSTGGGTDTQYYETDIKITGTTWAQTFPAVQTTSVLTVSPASPQPSGTTVNLTDTIGPASAAGTVQFMADGSNLGAAVPVSGGVATTSTSTLSVGSHTLTAVFSPTDPTAFAASTSNSVPYTISAIVVTNTQTGLAVDFGGVTPTAGAPVTFTATVSPTATPGTVQFIDNPGPTQTVIGTAGPGNGTFVLQTSFPTAGSHSVVATFTPTDTTHFGSSTSSPPVTFTLAPSACTTCTDVQTIIGTIPAGTLTITTPYTPANPLNLGVLTLNPAATQFSATATFQNIAISDTRSGSQPITAKAQSSNLTSGANIINSQNVGLTNLVPTFTPGNGIQAGQVTVFTNPAANPAVAPSAPGSQGLGGPTAHTIATVSSGPGSFSMNGTLTLNAPSSTPAGTYTGTITFTVG